MKSRPPLRALSVFEAAARLGSFLKAGQELGITTSAVSHQIRLLENHVGRPLFLRTNRGVRVSIDGAAYYEAIRTAYDTIDRGTHNLVRKPRPETLSVRCGVSFGLRWLTPRIPLFLAEFPDIDLRILTPTAASEARLRRVDVEIRYGAVDTPGMHVEPLFEESVLPLCSPALLSGSQPLRSPRDLGNFRLIDSEVAVVDWPHVLTVHRIDLSDPKRLRFDNILLALQAAVSGVGIALEGEFLAGEDLATGRLIVPPALRPLTTRRSLRSFVVPASQSRSEKVVLFRDWLFRMLETGCAASDPRGKARRDRDAEPIRP